MTTNKAQESAGDAQTDIAGSDGKTEDETAGDVEIEIEITTTTFEGEDLADNLSVSSNRGTSEVSIASDGSIGVSTEGLFFDDNQQVQMGETVTFTVPPELGEVQGATITVSKLVDSKTGGESALVMAFDSEGKEVFRHLIEGSEHGDVSIDIDVSFAKVDIKPVDNLSWTLAGNSDFAVKRVDVRTSDEAGGEKSYVDQEDLGGSDGDDWSSEAFLSDFLALFENRNFSLQSSVHRELHQSSVAVFPSSPVGDQNRDGDAAQQAQDQQSNEATGRAAAMQRRQA